MCMIHLLIWILVLLAHGHSHGGSSHSHNTKGVIHSSLHIDEERVKLDDDCDDEPSQTSDELSECPSPYVTLHAVVTMHMLMSTSSN